jgi:hypothetical protein
MTDPIPTSISTTQSSHVPSPTAKVLGHGPRLSSPKDTAPLLLSLNCSSPEEPKQKDPLDATTTNPVTTPEPSRPDEQVTESKLLQKPITSCSLTMQAANFVRYWNLKLHNFLR